MIRGIKNIVENAWSVYYIGRVYIGWGRLRSIGEVVRALLTKEPYTDWWRR